MRPAFSRRWTIKLLLACAAFAAALPLGELGVRTLTGERYALAGFRFPDWPGMNIFRPSSDLPYELVPNVPGWTNSLGMRGPERPKEGPPGVFRVAVLADSIGMYGRYPDLLEEGLNAGAAGRYEVWNWSIGGFGLQDYARILETRVLGHRPDLILLGLCLNDLDRTPVIFKDPNGEFHCYRPFRFFDGRLNNFLYPRSYLYRLFVSVLERPSGGDADQRARRRQDGDRALARIGELASARGIPVFAVIFPYLKPLADYQPGERQDWQDLRSLLAARRIESLDLSPSFPETERARWRAAPADTIHFNPAGSKIVASVILRELRSRRLLGQRRKGA